MKKFQLKINGKTYKVKVDETTPLLWVLRDELGLVGTKFGCGIGQCGACTVHFNGSATRSCLLPVSAVVGSEITTIEGLSENNDHPVQKAWQELDVPQCGYCQAGQIMTASAFIEENQNPSREEVRDAMHGNICRCAAYNRIENAVVLAAKEKQSNS
ncbi:(2Fe-2S)-binding protein [Flavicella sp.]|uniref:(2Fe-2S)-binding protein n=1 Tax=Flavicella sp. TaxID=2957742 RepID=UPI0026332ADE|nr:(2Fe-2S)-binding protein [Flavicella sp.]MDG1805577.1 (2Fe-2S)-binding protein [Flavicella sp.]